MRDQNVPAPVKLSSRLHPCEGPAGRVVTPHLLFQSRPWSSARSGHLTQDRSLRPALLQSSILEFLGQLVAPEITCQSIHLPAESYPRNAGPSEHCIPLGHAGPVPIRPQTARWLCRSSAPLSCVGPGTWLFSPPFLHCLPVSSPRFYLPQYQQIE